MNTVVHPIPVPPEIAALERDNWAMYKFELSNPIFNPIFRP